MVPGPPCTPVPTLFLRRIWPEVTGTCGVSNHKDPKSGQVQFWPPAPFLALGIRPASPEPRQSKILCSGWRSEILPVLCGWPPAGAVSRPCASQTLVSLSCNSALSRVVGALLSAEGPSRCRQLSILDGEDRWSWISSPVLWACCTPNMVPAAASEASWLLLGTEVESGGPQLLRKFNRARATRGGQAERMQSSSVPHLTRSKVDVESWRNRWWGFLWGELLVSFHLLPPLPPDTGRTLSTPLILVSSVVPDLGFYWSSPTFRTANQVCPAS